MRSNRKTSPSVWPGLPVSTQFDGQKFFTELDGRRALTPLALCLIMVETTDLIFAVDSIPAIFGITTEAFIVFTSNVFAILGLRSLYFVLVGLLRHFCYLKYGLALVLVFIGFKMLIVLRAGPVGLILARTTIWYSSSSERSLACPSSPRCWHRKRNRKRPGRMPMDNKSKRLAKSE